MQISQILIVLAVLSFVQTGSNNVNRVSGDEGIQIGIISDNNAEKLRKTFDYAIATANTDLGIPLVGSDAEINFGDSIQGYTRLCKFMQNGIGAIFGPSSHQTSTHLLTVCDAKDVPYIYPYMSEQSEGFNLYPHPKDLARILHDLINGFEWTRFIFLYESSDYLSILNGLLSFYVSSGPVINVQRYDLKLNGNYKAVLRRVRKSEDGQIVVVGSSSSVAELLRQAQQVGIINNKYSYIIGNLDFHTFDLEEYKYSETNITGMRMFSPDQSNVQDLITNLDIYEYDKQILDNGFSPITLEMALTYDAVQVFAETTKNLVYRPQPLNCSDQSDQVQPDGSTFRNYMRSRADLAITDLTITSERQEIIDFSIPFMNLGRLSPTEWDNPYPCIAEPEELENQFTLNNSFWFTTGAFLQQGSEIAPKSLSTRTLASIWWFFTLIILSSYTANLAAFLTIENPVGLIDSVEDLAENKGGVEYGAKMTGSTRNFFATSEHETYKKMNEFMTKNPHLLFKTNQEGVERVKSSSTFAFLMESTSIEYNIVRECNLMKIGEPLDEKGYGIAMVKNWPYSYKFSNALLELREQGVLARLKNKWWNEVGAGVCNKQSDNSNAKPLDLSNLGGVYLVLGVGSGLSLIYGVVMWFIYVARKARYYEVPFKAALIEEFRIAIDFGSNERLLKTVQSVYSRSRNSLVSIDSIITDSEVEESSDSDD
ncbi:glutamate receptor ionotropic, kainate 2-like isoform X8 [Eurosta solidaginis]|uniref:glutamate receptor ionotropic, kainate 2-like isoform X8 n=1 Tax=Eurosta solidaginis TaxID=178769 RepID=UPI00353102F9